MFSPFRFLLRPYHLAILLFITVLVPGWLPAQQHTASSLYNFRHFTDENGLPQNSVKAIIADKNGFIWLTTESGLVRYDGRRFVTYDQSVIPLHSNRMGSFYLAPGAPGNEHNGFFAVSNKEDCLLIKDGAVTYNNEGYKKFLSGMPFYHEYSQEKIFIDQSLPNIFKETIIKEKCIIPDETGGFFVCTSDTVSYYKGSQQQYEVAFHTPDFWSFFRMGPALFRADDKGLFTKIESGKIQPTALTGDMLLHPAYRRGIRNFEIHWSNATGQAFLYLKNNLYLLKTSASGDLVTRLILTDFDCATNNIISVYYDETGQLVYLGSLNKGLFTFSPRPFRALSMEGDDKDNIYYAQAAWGKDQVLTAQGNILGLTRSSVLPVMKQVAAWDRYNMLIDRKGYIWTRNGNDIIKFGKEGEKIIKKWHMAAGEPLLYESRDGQIWIGAGKMGLYGIDPFEADAVPCPVLTNTAFPAIYCLQEEGFDFLWIGTEKGLYRLHTKDGRIDTIKGLEQANIRSLYIPHQGEVWITTYGTGFFLYANHRLTGFPLDKGRYLATAHCFVEDSLGFCWIPTNKGLFQAAKKDLLNYAAGKQQQVFYLYHTREEGFNTNEFNGGCQPCAVKLANGYISLPSFNGVVWFSPSSLRTILPDKKIFIDRVEVDQVPVQLKDTLRLSRGFKLLKLYCSTPYTGNSYNVNMQYAWVNGKEEPVWLPLGNDMVISQSSLAPGEYALTIRKVNGFGGNNYSYRKLTVIMPPAFYETWWFYAVLLVLIVLLMILYGRLRMHYIRRKNKQLEELVNKRTEELSNALSALSISEQNIRRQLHVREILFTAISHDIGSPLKYMSMMAEELRDNLETANIPDKIKKYSDDIFQSGYYLYHLTRNLLQYLRISERNASLNYKQFDLHQIVENKTVIFQPIAREYRVSIINSIPPSVYLYSDPHLLEVVLHNLLDNAVKATRSGSITIRMAVVDGQTHLIVEDTGHGMRKEIANYYNNDQANEENAKPGGAYTGFGLNIVKELVRLLNVKIQIEAGTGGTVVHLVFRNQVLVPEKA